MINCSALSLALVKSIDTQNKPQLAIFVLYVSNKSHMKEEILDITALQNTTPGSEIKAILNTALR
jgi:hypothetical protein